MSKSKRTDLLIPGGFVNSIKFSRKSIKDFAINSTANRCRNKIVRGRIFRFSKHFPRVTANCRKQKTCIETIPRTASKVVIGRPLIRMAIEIDCPMVVVPFPPFLKIALPVTRASTCIILIKDIAVPSPYKPVKSKNFAQDNERRQLLRLVQDFHIKSILKSRICNRILNIDRIFG